MFSTSRSSSSSAGVARQSDDVVMRRATLCHGTVVPAADKYVRKIGGPRAEWTTEVGKLALQAAGGLHRMEETIQNDSAWRTVVETFYNRT